MFVLGLILDYQGIGTASPLFFDAYTSEEESFQRLKTRLLVAARPMVGPSSR